VTSQDKGSVFDSPDGETGAFPEVEYRAIFRKVPRLTVEVVICSELGVLLARRTGGPCDGRWNLPGGTVRFAEQVTAAVHRVARGEIGTDVTVDEFLGYIEYPSHLRLGVDWPVGLAFRTHLAPSEGEGLSTSPDRLDWFTRLPNEMHDEQRAFLRAHHLVD
jgi:ADP-ribose pyrophosphatase YjhB (NUDIX family)